MRSIRKIARWGVLGVVVAMMSGCIVLPYGGPHGGGGGGYYGGGGHYQGGGYGGGGGYHHW